MNWKIHPFNPVLSKWQKENLFGQNTCSWTPHILNQIWEKTKHIWLWWTLHSINCKRKYYLDLWTNWPLLNLSFCLLNILKTCGFVCLQSYDLLFWSKMCNFIPKLSANKVCYFVTFLHYEITTKNSLITICLSENPWLHIGSSDPGRDKSLIIVYFAFWESRQYRQLIVPIIILSTRSGNIWVGDYNK